MRRRLLPVSVIGRANNEWINTDQSRMRDWFYLTVSVISTAI